MAENSIPVDLFNPGQVFACLGFLEAAEVLLGDAEGGFDWSNEGNVRFRLRAKGGRGSCSCSLGILGFSTGPVIDSVRVQEHHKRMGRPLRHPRRG